MERDFLPRTPFNMLIGMRITRAHTDGLTIECTVRDDLRNAAGALHGGVTAAMADAAVGMSLFRHFGGHRYATTVELKVNYFRPVTEGRLFARARLLRIGAHLCVGSVELTDSQKRAVGAGLITYMLIEGPKPA
jgi:uncharacterized protein (TIGR00369 family)